MSTGRNEKDIRDAAGRAAQDSRDGMGHWNRPLGDVPTHTPASAASMFRPTDLELKAARASTVAASWLALSVEERTALRLGRFEELASALDVLARVGPLGVDT